ncbi:TPA: hypothetical protein JTN47_003055 [Escherichia coli]|nr:hypothetical protein [Escherichia coli]HAX6893915.1 hypothetical protein [Escherichia coli]HAX7097971.1 hypothetical protein [Escherichia coli]HAX7414622.1 hypothetical protein [Escherichia coli]HAX7517296.1 hypothetical protein [Escherichia coli]
MRLFIAEKPSLAKAIFEGLGGNPATEKKNGCYEHGTDVVTWCFGHMLELYGVVSRNRRNFRHASSTPATRASRSITLPSL